MRSKHAAQQGGACDGIVIARGGKLEPQRLERAHMLRQHRSCERDVALRRGGDEHCKR